MAPHFPTPRLILGLLSRIIASVDRNTQTPAFSPPGVGRFSVSLPHGLLRQLDQMAREKGYASRSHLVADMTRDWLVEHRRRQDDAEIAGTITLLYNHHLSHVQEALTAIQHDHHHLIVSTLHVHLDHHNCLEVLVVRGKAGEISVIADALIAARGVKHGKLTVTSTGKDLI
jgi:CopG family nickel-responsive transcriptional regulator